MSIGIAGDIIYHTQDVYTIYVFGRRYFPGCTSYHITDHTESVLAVL